MDKQVLHQNIAGTVYTFELVDGWLRDKHDRKCLGQARTDDSWVGISRAAKPTKRWKVCLHELVHVIKCELDIADREHLDEESLCNLISTGLCGIPLEDLARLRDFVMRE